MIGVYYGEWISNQVRKHLKPALLISGAALQAGNLVMYIGEYQKNGFATLALSMAGCVFFMSLCMMIGKFNFLESIGKQTLPIYALHGMVVAAFRLLLTRLNLNGTTGILPMLVCTTMGCALRCLLIGSV